MDKTNESSSAPESDGTEPEKKEKPASSEDTPSKTEVEALKAMLNKKKRSSPDGGEKDKENE